MTYLPGTRFLFDTSALARATNVDVLEILEAAVDDGVAATCVTVDLELGYSARNAAELASLLHTRREHYQYLPVTSAAAERASQVQLLMARRGLHRAAGAVDLLTAAVAEHHRAILVHYDADFDHIASVTGQQTRWIVARGSVD